MEEKLKELYTTYVGEAPAQITQLSQAGSNRRYFRLTGKQSLIGVAGTSEAENEAFLYMAGHFRSQGLNVPEIFAVSDDRMCYLQEDLGDISLFQAIEQGRTSGNFSNEEINLLEQTIALLPDFQFKGNDGMDYEVCYPTCCFNRRSVLWDLNYFKYCFLKATGLEFQEEELEDDFERMTDKLLQVPSDCFMYRDFQSRNVMLSNGKLFFIDFQGGRKGPFYYDVASFLWQAKANLPQDLRERLIDVYLNALQPHQAIGSEEFRQTLRHFVLFRTLQVLGAYGFRGYFERKQHFIESVPFAIANLAALLEQPFEEYPYLNKLLPDLCRLPQFAAALNRKKLTVTVMSFSYRKGIPQDKTDNGGGFVFDCRAVHNPGRYDAYKALTGRDEAVIRFLEEDGEITTFLQHVDALVDASVERYLKRGFTHLMVCFGCTGGQHRSVYSAQHVAEHLHKKYGIRVELEHREQHISEVFNAL